MHWGFGMDRFVWKEGVDVVRLLMGGNVYTAGTVLIVFFSLLNIGFNISQLTPSLARIAQGRAAAARIFKIIDRETFIKSKENAVYQLSSKVGYNLSM